MLTLGHATKKKSYFLKFIYQFSIKGGKITFLEYLLQVLMNRIFLEKDQCKRKFIFDNFLFLEKFIYTDEEFYA